MLAALNAADIDAMKEQLSLGVLHDALPNPKRPLKRALAAPVEMIRPSAERGSLSLSADTAESDMEWPDKEQLDVPARSAPRAS